MMPRFFIVIFLLFMIACTAKQPESNIPANSEIASSFPDGKPSIVKVFKDIDGKKEWVGEIQFHQNGNKSMEGSIKNGLRYGEWKSYYSDGKIWSKGFFKNGLREGHGLVYYPNGEIQIDGYYAKGERTGIWKSFDEHGNMVSETDYSIVEPQ